MFLEMLKASVGASHEVTAWFRRDSVLYAIKVVDPPSSNEAEAWLRTAYEETVKCLNSKDYTPAFDQPLFCETEEGGTVYICWMPGSKYPTP